MGIDSWVFKATKRAYKGTFQDTFPDNLKQRRHVALEDLQKVIKAKPDFITNIHGFLKHVVDCIVSRMRRKDIPSPHFTALFDRWTPPAKAAIAHVKRDKGVDPIPYDVNKPVLDGSEPRAEQEVMKSVESWRRYTSNRELVRRELYPLIFNAFLNDKYFCPEEGEQLILHGLPGQWVYRQRAVGKDYAVADPRGVPELVPRSRITPEDEQDDPDLYNRVFCIKRAPREPGSYVQGQVLRFQWEEAKSNTGEADLAIVQYWQYFKECHHLVYMDDGDSLPICLLHAFDRLQNGTFCGKEFWICKPRKGTTKERPVIIITHPLGMSSKEEKRRKREKKPREKWTEQERADHEKIERICASQSRRWETIENQRPKELFINVNDLFVRIMGDPRLKSTQNPVLFYVLAIVLSGTDFFGHVNSSGSFIPGFGVEKKIWPVLFARANTEYSHLIQSSMAPAPDPRRWRDVVVDEEAFVQFCKTCYVENTTGATCMDDVHTIHASREVQRKSRLMKKNAKSSNTLTNMLSTTNAASLERGGVNTKNVVVSEEVLRMYARHVEQNITYWFNAMRPGHERSPDILQRDGRDLSCWGFTKDPVTGAYVTTTDIGDRAYPVDEVYASAKRRKTEGD